MNHAKNLIVKTIYCSTQCELATLKNEQKIETLIIVPLKIGNC